jgi:hypothetical protein
MYLMEPLDSVFSICDAFFPLDLTSNIVLRGDIEALDIV